jgi:hypothetical protein
VLANELPQGHGHLKHHGFLIQSLGSERARVFAAVTWIDHDRWL